VYTNSFTVQTQSTQGAEVVLGSPTQVDVTLTVNTHSYIAYVLGDLQLQQIASSYDVFSMYAKKAAATLVDSLEDALFALWSGLTTNSVGDTATVLSDAEIRAAIEKLDSANFNLGECAWFFSPYTYWNQILAIQKYYDQSQFSTSYKGAVATGTLDGRDISTSKGFRGYLYGIRVFVSSNVVSGLQTYRNLLAHKTAFGYAIQTPGGSLVRSQMQNWIANLGTLCVHDMVYGVAELRDSAAVVVNGSSSFLGS
jgi:hypothetical protein